METFPNRPSLPARLGKFIFTRMCGGAFAELAELCKPEPVVYTFPHNLKLKDPPELGWEYDQA